MNIARRVSAYRRGLIVQAAEREAHQGRVEAAFSRLERAASDKDIETRRLALQTAARLAAAHGRPAESAEHLRSLVRMDDSAIEAWRALAQRLEEIGETPEAVYAWRRILSLGGENLALRLHVAGLVETYGDRAAQVEAWEEAERADPAQALPHRRLTDLLQWDAPARALPHLQRLAELEPGDQTSRQLVLAAERLGDLKSALPHLQRVTEIESTASAFRRLALLLASLGDKDGAAAAWRSVLKRDGAALDAHLWLAERFETEAPAQAVPHLKAATKASRADPALRKRLARAAALAGEEVMAAEAWLAASDLAPGDMEAARAAGGALLTLGRPDEAIAVMRRFTKVHPGDAKVRRSLVGVARKQKDVALEAELLGELAALVEDPLEFLVPLAALLQGAGQPLAAVPHLAAIAAARPDSAPDLLRYAAGLEAADQPTKAVEAWRALIALQPDDRNAHTRLAALLDTLGRRAEAAQHMLRVAEIQPGELKSWNRLASRQKLVDNAAGEALARERIAALKPDDIDNRRRLAELLFALRRRPDAKPHLEALADQTPDDLWVWNGLADLRLAAEDSAGAMAALRRVIALDPTAIAAHDRLSRLLDAAEDRAGAVPHMLAVARATPDQDKGWRRLAARLLQLGDTEAAIEPLERLVVLDPEELGHADKLAEALLAAGRVKEAMPHVWRVTRAFPKNFDRWRKTGSLLESLGRTDEALDAWRPVAASNPDDVEAHQHLASLYLKADRAADALPHLRVLAAARPEHLPTLRQLVTTQAKLGPTDDLGPALERLHAAKPTDITLLRRVAAARARAGDHEAALTALRSLEAQRPGDLDVTRQLALTLAELKDVDGAIAAWRAVLVKQPDDLEAQRRLSGLLYGEKRRPEALEHLRAIVAQERDDVRAWRRIASIVADDGDAAAQIAAWRDVVAVDPDDLGAHEQLVGLLENSDLDAAMPHLQATARLTPDKVKPWKRLGKWLQDEGRNAEAIEAWSTSLAIAPDDVETHRRLAQLYLLTGDYRSGLRRLNSFAQMNDEQPPALAGLAPEAPALAATPLVSAVILSLEGAELLEQLFSTFAATNSYPAVELIVIDHASTDDTAKVLDTWQDKLPIRRIMRDANYSYSASCNLGVREAKGELVLLLNNDVVFHEDVLGEMVRNLTPDVGIVGLKQYNSAPLPEEVLRPYHIGVRFAWDAGGRWFKPRHAIPTLSDQMLGAHPAWFPAVTASILMCRKSDYLAIGGLDEAFVYGHEDLDFCCKMRLDHGKAIISLNSRAAFHSKNSTRKGADAETRRQQGLANEALFRGRWAGRIADEYLGRLFSDDGSYRGRPPTVAFGLKADAPDTLVARAYALGEGLVARLGWRVRYILDDEPGWSDGDGIDAVLGLGDFATARVKSREPYVVRAAIAAGGASTPPADLVLTDADQTPEAFADTLRTALEGAVAGAVITAELKAGA